MSEELAISLNFAERLIAAGVIPENCVSFTMTMSVNEPVRFAYEVIGRDYLVHKITKTLEDVVRK